nr:MAG TPA: hypothetical protein [Caudoviricetes sp.]
MAIQCRHGKYADFKPEKLVTAEWATVTDGDPNAKDGKGVYHCFAPGIVKRMATYEDMKENVDNATKDIQDSFTESVTEATAAANSAATAANEAKTAANTAATAANEAAIKANAAAGGDIAEKTVTFTEATTRTNISTGEKLSVMFGKIAKWFTDLKSAAFYDVKNDLTQETPGKSVLDAAQGKELAGNIDSLNDRLTRLCSVKNQTSCNIVPYGIYEVYNSVAGSNGLPAGENRGMVVGFCALEADVFYQLFLSFTGHVYYRVWKSGIDYGTFREI